MKLLLLIMVISLAGCTTIERLAELQNPPVEKGYEQYEPSRQGQSFHYHVEQLARQLLNTTNQFNVSQPILVGTFLPSDTLSMETNRSIAPFGIQIQESLVTFLTQAGLKVTEFKVQTQADIAPTADIFMSRNVNSLEKNVTADYLLVGHYIQQENELIVNARLIDLSDKTVVAAATDYIPMNTMWSHEKVKLKNEQLYRGEY
ncbi:FlgO family outer membrane protein [Psychrosphaera aestuarii]|uniref:FlgO family outer membrane protein n=1 Tax=Psychrosphaera aestuarii TaxID=1266052 RepID=UPI001B31BC11|nr:FlgO family outer membrane protein [Psychrosphaera aestuarii]